MAVSPSHRLGQFIGNFIEYCFTPMLNDFCIQKGFYLDVVGRSRPARRGKKVSWVDFYGSEHDLDFVIEFNGTDERIGRPLAFIESAWRRYTKHSKNKAQEIQGAILPIVESYNIECPFKGAILAGYFTGPSLVQLRESGFEVLYIEYDDIVAAFTSIGVDVSFDERTSSSDLSAKADAVNRISNYNLESARTFLLTHCRLKIDSFIQALAFKLDKVIKNIIITPTYGNSVFFATVDDAVNFIRTYNPTVMENRYNFLGFLVMVEYVNNDIVKGEFGSPVQAENFLRSVINMGQ